MAENISTRCLRLKVKPESYAWLNAAAVEVNQVWNWANETSEKAVRRFAGKSVWLTGFDLNNLSAGASKLFDRIGADTIQRVNGEYATKRRTMKRVRLSWRKSGGSRRSLGWVPFKAANLKRKGNSIRFCGRAFRVFEANKLDAVKWRDGQFAQDSVGDWWLCLPVQFNADETPAPREIVGIDLGLKDTAVTSDGDRLTAGTYYRDTEPKIAQAQRRGHKQQAKRLHRKASRQRMDALHKFTTGIVCQYQNIIVGDVSSVRLAKTRMAKSVLDSGWGMLKQQLLYKGQWAGRAVEVVNEAYTTRACSSCGSLSGPSGLRQLVVREWQCGDCGALHDRDVNAARNIANLGSRRSTSVCGNKSHLVEVMA
jgi:putative transposase